MSSKPSQFFLIASAFCSVLALASCSRQWMDGNPTHTPAEVTSLLAEVQSAQSQGGSGDLTAALQNANTAVVYFADAPSDGITIPSLLSFGDFSFLGSNAESYVWGNISEARVFFLDQPTDSGEAVGLVVGINQGSGYSYYAFSGNGTIDGENFSATLTGGNGSQITVRSNDVNKGALASVVQLSVYQTDSGGNELYLGKFSVLFGYTQ